VVLVWLVLLTVSLGVGVGRAGRGAAAWFVRLVNVPLEPSHCFYSPAAMVYVVLEEPGAGLAVG
jgi:hypothetical protein